MRIAALVASSLVTVALAAGCKEAPKEQPAPAVAKIDPVQKGAELVKLGGCTDCHTPMEFDPKLGMPVPKMDRYLSAHHSSVLVLVFREERGDRVGCRAELGEAA